MTGHRIQFFQNSDLATLAYEINEFASSLPDELVEVVDIKPDPSWTKFYLIYRLKKSEDELKAMAKQLAEEEKRRLQEEATRPVSEEELKKIVQENWNKNNKDKNEGDSATPTQTIKPPPDSPPDAMAPPIAAATVLEYDEPPPKVVDKSKPIQDQPELLRWMTNMLAGKEVIRKEGE